MKRSLACMLVSLAVLITLFPKTGECARKTLYEWLESKSQPVKAYVADVTDSSGQGAECIPVLKKDMEEMLASRKKVTFTIVQDKKDADMILACDVVECFWTDSDPVDEISGLGPVLMDAAMKENYSRLTAVFTISDGREGAEIWKSKLKATLTGKDVTKENYVQEICARMMKVLTKGSMTKRVDAGLVTGTRAGKTVR